MNTVTGLSYNQRVLAKEELAQTRFLSRFPIYTIVYSYFLVESC